MSSPERAAVQLQYLRHMQRVKGVDVEGARVDDLLLPLVVYRNAFDFAIANDESDGKDDAVGSAAAKALELLKVRGWSAHSWVWNNGLDKNPHFHDNTHELVVVLRGSCTVAWGQAGHLIGTLGAGDVAFHPAGLWHAGASCSPDCVTLGVYPDASPKWQMLMSKPTRAQHDKIQHISASSIADPVCAGDYTIQIWYDDLQRFRGVSGPISWDVLSEIVRVGRLELLGRDGEALKVYKSFMAKVRNDYRSVEDFILITKFGDSFELDAEGKRRALPVDDTESKTEPELLWSTNEFPYNVEKGISHFIIWTRGALTEAQAKQAAEAKFPSEKYEHIVFVNPPHLQSIRGLKHAHVFCRARAHQ